MPATEVLASWSDIWLAAATTGAILLAVIVHTRILGLRSFSKMSAFDFTMTLAVGSTVASVGGGGTSLAIGVTVIATLYGLQWLVALARRDSRAFEHAIDNTPILLLADGEFVEPHLDRTRVTRSDVIAKLRQANVLRLADARAVVLETTGDISVLHGEGDVDVEVLLDGVIGGERVQRRAPASN